MRHGWSVRALTERFGKTIYDDPSYQFDSAPNELVVQLRAAPLPFVRGKLAVHLYLLTARPGQTWNRWELWHHKNAFSEDVGTREQVALGHVHKNLKPPLGRLRNSGPTYGIQTWTGDEAMAILRSLRDSLKGYRFHHRYFAWPGPNSNTYISKVLWKAGVKAMIPGSAIGKHYHRGAEIKRHGRSREWRLNTPIAGVRFDRTGWECHVLGLSVGRDRRAGKWIVPFGRGLA